MWILLGTSLGEAVSRHASRCKRAGALKLDEKKESLLAEFC